MFICQHVVAVKQGLVTACLGKLVVRVNVDANHLVKKVVNLVVKLVVNLVVKLVVNLVVKVVANQNQKQIEDQITLVL